LREEISVECIKVIIQLLRSKKLPPKEELFFTKRLPFFSNMVEAEPNPGAEEDEMKKLIKVLLLTLSDIIAARLRRRFQIDNGGKA